MSVTIPCVTGPYTGVNAKLTLLRSDIRRHALPALRPVAKQVIKGGLLVTDKAKELFAEAGERWSDLVAEARADLQPKSVATAAPAAPGDATAAAVEAA